jgi:hypothetical protein
MPFWLWINNLFFFQKRLLKFLYLAVYEELYNIKSPLLILSQ